MGKFKNLEKKAKASTEFDKKSPTDRVKSINNESVKKKSKILKKSEKISKAKKDVDIKKNKKKKKVKIITQIKQEIESNAKKIETNGINEDSNKLVSREVVKKALIALKDGVKKESEKNTMKNLFDDELRIGLQIIAMKVADCPPHVKKILLTHSLFEEYPDICFFIRDAKPKKADQEANIREFQQKLDQAGVKCKKIMTLTQLKKDYNTHNLKHKLCNLYDVFLVEPEIAEHVYSILGKNFIVKRKRPCQISTEKTSILKDCVEKAIRKVNFKLNGNSNISCFEVGTIKMDNVQIADNIMSGIEQLKEKWPGGWRNINRLYLRPMRQSKVSIPIFYSNINPNDVEVPVIKGDKKNRLEKLANELKLKAKKLKLDIKTKKIVKKNAEVPRAKKIENSGVKQENENAAAVKNDQSDKKKGKKDLESAEVNPLSVNPAKKKKKKHSEINDENALIAEPEKKKIKKDSESISENPLSNELEKKKKNKNKKQKKNQIEAKIIKEKVEEPLKLKKKNKKKGKNVKSEDVSQTTEPAVDQQPKLKESKKGKNKKKSKVLGTESIDKNEIKMTSKTQQPLKKMKKDKNKKKNA